MYISWRDFGRISISGITTTVGCAHEQKAHGQLKVWSIGEVNTKLSISGDPGDLKQSQASFFASFDSLIVLTIRSDAYISRSGDFRDDDNRRTNRLPYPRGGCRTIKGGGYYTNYVYNAQAHTDDHAHFRHLAMTIIFFIRNSEIIADILCVFAYLNINKRYVGL